MLKYKLRSIIILILLLFFNLFITNVSIAQKIELNDTIFYNNKWQICEKPVAAFYRIGKMIIDDYTFFTGEVKDYYMNDALQMKGTFDQKGFKNGLFTTFYRNGMIENEGRFENNKMKGVWNYYTNEGKNYLKVNYDDNNTQEDNQLDGPNALLLKKHSSIDDMRCDYAFGNKKESSTNLGNFLFNHISPIIISKSESFKNNMVDYINCASAAISSNLKPSSKLIFKYPQKDFADDGWLIFSELSPSDSSCTLFDIDATISFNILNNGSVDNISINGKIDTPTIGALKYYFSILRNLSACINGNDCKVSLTLKIDQEVGYQKTIKSISSQGVVKYANIDSSYKDILLVDSVFAQKIPAVFPSGKKGWEKYLNNNLSRVVEMTGNRISESLFQTITVSFLINEMGDVTEAKISYPSDPNPWLAEQSLKIIQNSPKWVPAEFNGKKIKYKLTQPISWSFTKGP